MITGCTPRVRLLRPLQMDNRTVTLRLDDVISTASRSRPETVAVVAPGMMPRVAVAAALKRKSSAAASVQVSRPFSHDSLTPMSISGFGCLEDDIERL